MGIVKAPFKVIVTVKYNNIYSSIFIEAYNMPDIGLSTNYFSEQKLG